METPKKIAKLSNDTNFTILVQDNSIQIDKKKLFDESKYFRALIEHEETKNNDRPINEISLNDVPFNAVKCLVDYINTKDILLNQNNILENYTYGDFFCDENLLTECRKFLIAKLDRLCEPSPDLLKIAVLIVSQLVDDGLTDHICQILAKNPDHFVKYIQEIGLKKFSRAVTKCEMIIRDQNYLYMGQEYYKKLREFLTDTFPNDLDLINKLLKEPIKCYEQKLNFVVPWALQEDPKPFGSVTTLKGRNINSVRFSTCGSLYDPADWVLCGMNIYFLKIYGKKYKGRGVRPIAGIDVYYRNIWSGKEINSACHLKHTGTKYSNVEFRLEPGETIKRVHIRADYRIESLEFLTSHGRELGPFGRPRPLNEISPRQTIDPPHMPLRGFKAPEKNSYPPFIPSQLKRSLDEPLSSAREEGSRPRFGLCRLTQIIENNNQNQRENQPPSEADPPMQNQEDNAPDVDVDEDVQENLVERMNFDMDESFSNDSDSEVEQPLVPTAEIHPNRVIFDLPYHFCPSKPQETLNMTGLVLHGFSYNLCSERKRLYWNQVRLIFAGIPQEISRTHRPLGLENLNLRIS